MTVIGSAASVSAGESIEAQGAWVNDREHGLQFRADQLRVVPPTTLEGIEKYLGSGMVKGIGPKRRERKLPPRRSSGSQATPVNLG
jgi:exodeoxyribonuclease V alpha subunit